MENLFVEGRSAVGIIAGELFVCHRGSIVRIPAGAFHAMRTEDDGTILLEYKEGEKIIEEEIDGGNTPKDTESLADAIVRAIERLTALETKPKEEPKDSPPPEEEKEKPKTQTPRPSAEVAAKRLGGGTVHEAKSAPSVRRRKTVGLDRLPLWLVGVLVWLGITLTGIAVWKVV